MKKIYLLILLAFIFSESQGQIPYKTSNTASAYPVSNISLPTRGIYFAIGARLGDPLGITAKSWSQHGTALEFSLGRPTRWWYNNGYYEDRFYSQGGFDREVHSLQNIDVKYGIAFQVHYLKQKDIRRYPGLDWYYGIGGQIRVKSYEYEYSFIEASTGTRVDSTDRLTEFDFGPDGVIGLEYVFDAPFIVFVDLTLFLEFMDNLFIYPQPGIGVRYHF